MRMNRIGKKNRKKIESVKKNRLRVLKWKVFGKMFIEIEKKMEFKEVGKIDGIYEFFMMIKSIKVEL